jgi:tetratricopeptide (TPR) repeat protein
VKDRKNIFLILFVFLSISLSSSGQRYLTEQDFKAIFNEATKNFLFGKYVQAVNLYKECLRINPASGTTHYQLSKVYLSAGNIQLAREHAKNAVKYESDNKWYLQALGDIYQMEQKPDSAIRIYENLLQLDSDNLNVMYGVALLYEKMENYDKTLSYLQLIDNRIGPSKETAMARYRVFESTNKPENAVNELKSISVISPEDYLITGMIAEYYQNHNKTDSASYYFRRIFPSYKSDPNVVFSYSNFLMENNKIDSARQLLLEVMHDTTVDRNVKAGYLYNILRDEENFRMAEPLVDTIADVFIKGYENDVRSLAVYADVSLRLRNYVEASWALTGIARQDPSNYPVLEQLVYVLNILGRSDSVIYFAEKAMKLQPRKPIVYLIAGSAYYQKKDYSGALKELNKGLALTDDSSIRLDFYSLLAECYQQLSRYEESEQAFRQALEIDEDNLAIRNNYAYYLALREKELRFARKLSKRTIREEPTNATYLDTYGWILFKMGKKQSAERYIREAIENGSADNEEVLAHYAEVLIGLGDYPGALKYLERIIKMSDKTEAVKAEKRIGELKGIIK